ncbi:hypothetical protein OPV22_025529 [Ensete ventricosum]|uniref:Uncharacterized protein n=1 Tax=Ensete ventricosum TaxID=4639 RepID=A0AAV8Q7N4_ENSVE|nr:hypothetical protein OPV22_025529 [Ensete ventricosum]
MRVEQGGSDQNNCHPSSSLSSPLLPRRLHRIDLLPRHRLPVPVISVGNLTWGRQWVDAHGGIHRPCLRQSRNTASHPRQGNHDQELYVIMCCISVDL